MIKKYCWFKLSYFRSKIVNRWKWCNLQLTRSERKISRLTVSMKFNLHYFSGKIIFILLKRMWLHFWTCHLPTIIIAAIRLMTKMVYIRCKYPIATKLLCKKTWNLFSPRKIYTTSWLLRKTNCPQWTILDT